MPDNNSSEPLPQIHIPGVSDSGAPDERLCVHHVFIIDASGSMRSLRKATIDGFNEQVQNIRQLERNNPNARNLVTLVVFNGVADVRFFEADSNSLQEITEADYNPLAKTLTVSAATANILSPSSFYIGNVDGLTTNITFTSSIQVPNLTAPPSTVTVYSTHGGASTVSVTVGIGRAHV